MAITLAAMAWPMDTYMWIPQHGSAPFIYTWTGPAGFTSAQKYFRS